MASTEDSVYDSVKSVLYGPSLTDWGGDKPSKNNETGTTSDVRSQITVGSRRLEKNSNGARRSIDTLRGSCKPDSEENWVGVKTDLEELGWS